MPRPRNGGGVVQDSSGRAPRKPWRGDPAKRTSEGGTALYGHPG